MSSQHFAADYFAPRRASERLITKRLNLRGLKVMCNWRVLDECLAE
jgi:dTDP-4-dehydrorhamnose reductase